MRIHRSLAGVVLFACASASAAPAPEGAVPEHATRSVAVDVEGFPNAAFQRANPNYSGLVLIRLDGLRPSSFSLAGVVSVSRTPEVVPLEMDLWFENTYARLPPMHEIRGPANRSNR